MDSVYVSCINRLAIYETYGTTVLLVTLINQRLGGNMNSNRGSKNGNGKRGMPVYKDYNIHNRAEALKDGALIDVSSYAKLLGISHPVAVTKAVFANCIKWTQDENAEDKERDMHQDEKDRLWNILFALDWILNKSDADQVVSFDIHVLPDDGFSYAALRIKIKVVVSGDEQSDRFIIMMLHNENEEQ